MCSSVLGPAMPPPFVTCPTSSTAGPVSFANRMSRAAHSRTWPTLPGAPSSSSGYGVWIESTNTTFGSRARARGRTGGLPDGAACLLSERPPARPTASSTSVFHAPQESQRPAHFGCSAPQSVQRNTECTLATDRLGRRLARREVVEPRVFLLEEQLHGAGGPVALLPDDELGHALEALVGPGAGEAVEELLAVD